MAASYVGKAAVYGMGSDCGATSPGLGTILIQSIDFTPDADQIQIMDATGQTVGMAFCNQKQTVAIEGIFVGTSIALAKTAASTTPKPGDILTLVETDDTEMAGTNTGKYVITECTKKKSNKGLTSVSLKAIQFVAADITGAIV